MKRTPMPPRKTPLASVPSQNAGGLARVVRLKPRSKTRAKQEREYTQLRRGFLNAHPYCQFPTGCRNTATEVHHKRGRVGADLLGVDHWLALCHDCHAWATERPAAALQLGVSERRIRCTHEPRMLGAVVLCVRCGASIGEAAS